jgi:sugar (pentulose or hexulose) kinase
MTGDVLLGIDLGTTVLKVAAFDARSGEALGVAAARLPLRTDADGTREQDPKALDRALRRAAGELSRKLGKAWSRVAGVGLAAQGGSAIIADRATGEHHTPMQLWSDTRPLHLLGDIANRKPDGYWRRLSYLDDPGAGLARMQWLRARRPGLFSNDNIYVGAGEYIFFKLTGTWRQDAGSALQIGCYNARSHRLASGPLKLIDIPVSFVAPMRRGHETRPLSSGGAALLGLREGIPATGPYLDHEAGYLSAVGGSSRPLQVSLGTAWVGNFVNETGPSLDGLNLVLPSPVGAGSLVVRVMVGGNASWDWARETLLGAKGAKALTQADAVFREGLLPPEGLVALPWLTRPNPFAPDAFGSGAFFGTNTHTTRADLLRALVAGMCFELAHVFEPVRESGDVDRVVLGGGASNGWYFRELLAGLFAPLPVFHLEEDETPGARGALYPFSRKAARAGARRVRRPPKRVHARILEGYKLYNKICATLSMGLPNGGLLHGYQRRTHK